MILSESDVNSRLESPLNLINRLRRDEKAEVVSLPERVRSQPERLEIFTPPSIDQLIENAEDKIKLSLAHDKAIEVLGESVNLLSQRLGEIEKAKDLSRVATDMSRVLSSIEEVRGNRSAKGNSLVVFQPVIVTENHYEVVRVNE